MSRVAVVTGSNKGIGLALVETLCKKHPDWAVYLTARSVERGQAAVDKLKANGMCPLFHQLDISDAGSIEKLKEHLVKIHGGLDVLVNNAAIAYKVAATEPFSEQAQVTCKVNYFDVWNTCDILFPILRPHARVVNVSSRAGSTSLGRLSKELQTRFCSPDLSRDDLDNLIHQFVSSAQQGTHQSEGWAEANTAYGISKIGVTCMTFIQQRGFDKDPREDLVVNSCSPGYVVTDMTSGKGHKTPIEGADTLYYLATLPDEAKEPKGKFVAERQVLKWRP